LQLDRAREVEALALEEQGTREHRSKIDVEVLLVVFLGSGDNRHARPLNFRERCRTMANAIVLQLECDRTTSSDRSPDGSADNTRSRHAHRCFHTKPPCESACKLITSS